MDEWQTIDTAPKSCRVLLFRKYYAEDGSFYRSETVIGSRNPTTPDWAVESWPAWAVREERYPEHWFDYWMPIPDDPK